MNSGWSRRTVIAGGAMLGLAARRAKAAEFYDGKTLTILCGYNPGGGVDLGTRLIADHIGPFIPGSPRVIVQNMEGAGGIIAANNLYAKADRDGLTLAVPGRDWLLKPLLGFSNARFDPLKIAYIGSTGATNIMAFIRADSGVGSAGDLKSAKRKILFGGLPGTTINSAGPKALSLLQWPVEVITGYENTSRIIYAMEQKELDAIYTAESSFARRRDLLDNRTVLIIFQSSPEQPGLPTTESLVDEKDRALMRLAHGQVSVGMPLVAPPGVPADRVEVLREAFMTMAADPTFQQHAQRIDEPFGAPLTGAAIEQEVRKLIAGITPATVQAYSRL